MDWQNYLRFAAALIFVLGLIGLLAMLARRLGLAPRASTAGGGRRLRIVEVLTIDARHRLILIRRDATEHLVLLGQNGDLVVEAAVPAPPEPSLPLLKGVRP